jgi:hypothetical protein
MNTDTTGLPLTPPPPPPQPGGFWQHKSLEELAAEQGVRPVEDLGALRADFWPADESADAVMAQVRRWRQEGERGEGG